MSYTWAKILIICFSCHKMQFKKIIIFLRSRNLQNSCLFYVIQFCRQQTPRGWYRIIWYLQNILLFTIGSLRTRKHILSTWPIRHARVLHVTWPTNQTIVILRSAHGAQPIRTRPHYAEEIWKRDIHLGQKRFSPPFRVRFKHIIIVTFSKCFSPH